MRRRHVWAVVGAALASALALYSCSGGESATQPPPADSADIDAAGGDGAASDTTSPAGDGANDAEAGPDAIADAAPDTLWVDGEFCPSPQWPPRSDGCPCDPESGSGIRCHEAILGKVCDYYLFSCPPGPARRYTCGWKKPSWEEPAYLGWIVSPIPCKPVNDAAPEG